MAKTIALICGMHRSGTSLTSSIVKELGFYAGNYLIKGDKGNVKGYFEDYKIVQLNDAILAKLNSNWNDINFPLEPKIYNYKLASFLHKYAPLFIAKLCPSYTDLAQKIIKTDFGNQENIVLKDPRITVLLPFWLNIFKIMGYQIKLIYCVRRPIEVCESLYKRDKQDYQTTLNLWLRYNNALYKHSQTLDKTTLNYKNLQDKKNRQDVIREVAEFIYSEKPLLANKDKLINKAAKLFDVSVTNRLSDKQKAESQRIYNNLNNKQEAEELYKKLNSNN